VNLADFFKEDKSDPQNVVKVTQYLKRAADVRNHATQAVPFSVLPLRFKTIHLNFLRIVVRVTNHGYINHFVF
jgi:hypothetical protein